MIGQNGSKRGDGVFLVAAVCFPASFPVYCCLQYGVWEFGNEASVEGFLWHNHFEAWKNTPRKMKKRAATMLDTYTLLHELACNIVSYCTSGRGIFTSRRRVKMQPTSEIIAICMLTSVIKCLLSIPEQRLVSSHTKYQVTRRSNALILIKAHRGC